MDKTLLLAIKDYHLQDVMFCNHGNGIRFTYNDSRYNIPFKFMPTIIQNLKNGLPILFTGRLVDFDEN